MAKLRAITDAYFSDPQANQIEDKIDQLELELSELKRQRHQLFDQYLRLGEMNKLPPPAPTSPDVPYLSTRWANSPPVGYVKR